MRYLAAKAVRVASDAVAKGVILDNPYEQLMASLDALYEEHKARVDRYTKGLH